MDLIICFLILTAFMASIIAPIAYLVAIDVKQSTKGGN